MVGEEWGNAADDDSGFCEICGDIHGAEDSLDAAISGAFMGCLSCIIILAVILAVGYAAYWAFVG